MRLIYAAVFALAAVPQGRLLYQSAKGDFSLSNFSQGTADFDLEKHSTSFKGEGKPARLSAPDRGLDVSAPSMSGTLFEEAGKSPVISKLDASGGVTVSMDTEKADAYLKSAGKPLPKRPETTVATFTSDVVAYHGERSLGTMEFAEPFKGAIRSSGTRSVVPKAGAAPVIEAIQQTFQFSAQKGEITLDPEGTGNAAKVLKTGSFEGQVHFHIVRNSMRAGLEKPSVTDVTADARKGKFDFTGTERKIELIGNVVITNTGDFSGRMEADSATIYVDENLKVTRIQTTGSPIQSRFSQPGGGAR